MVYVLQKRVGRCAAGCGVALAAGLAASPALAQGLDQGQAASTSANFFGSAGPGSAGFFGSDPFFGTTPGTASVSRTTGGTYRSASYSASGSAAAAPLGGGAVLQLRTAASMSVSIPEVPDATLVSTAGSVSSIATAADRFIVPAVADGSTFVTVTLSGRISGTQSRSNDLISNNTYLIGNPGLISQTSVWESRLDEGSGLLDRNFSNVGFSFSAFVGVDPWGWMVGMQLISVVAWTGGPGLSSGAVNDFASTIVVDSLTVRSGLTGAVLAPSEFTFSAGSGRDYSAFIVPAPGAASVMGVAGLVAARRRRA